MNGGDAPKEPVEREIEIRPYRPGDEAAILQSFNIVFREVCGSGYVDRQPSFWEWEFARNPEGHRIAVAMSSDGVVAAHYAGVPVRVDTAFGARTFVQGVDSFTHPDFRKGLKKPGLFVETAMPWFDECRARGDAVIYGYPVPIAERIGKRYLGYDPLHVVDYLCLDVDVPGVWRGADAKVTVTRESRVPEAIDELYERFRAGRGCLLRRDLRYLDWRYAQAPGDDYEFYAARRGEALAGFVVLRPVHELAPGACTIVDCVVPADDDAAAAALLATCHARARERGRRMLMAVFPAISPEFQRLLDAGFTIEPSSRWLERRLMLRSFDAKLTPEWMAEHWWYTLGDSDLA